MTTLIAALTAFVGTHFLMSHPLRSVMVKALGGALFQIVYSLISLATFAWVVLAFKATPRTADLWPVSEMMWSVSTMLMLIASILFAGSVMRNPALPRPDAAKLAAAPARGALAITRHPMMWSFGIWALAHALVAPYAAGLMLTGGMAILAIGGSLGQDAKKAALMGDGWRDWAARTSFVPFGNQLSGKASWGSIWPGTTIILVGVVIWLVASRLHPVQGAPVVGIWRWFY
ncbi:MAG: NnrU family protein [Sphingomonadaceae bacterium]